MITHDIGLSIVKMCVLEKSNCRCAISSGFLKCFIHHFITSILKAMYAICHLLIYV